MWVWYCTAAMCGARSKKRLGSLQKAYSEANKHSKGMGHTVKMLEEHKLTKPLKELAQKWKSKGA
jgi:hypothetical protein